MESYLIIIMEYCHARLPEAHVTGAKLPDAKLAVEYAIPIMTQAIWMNAKIVFINNLCLL